MENLIDLMKMDVEKIHVVISIEYIVNFEKMEHNKRTYGNKITGASKDRLL